MVTETRYCFDIRKLIFGLIIGVFVTGVSLSSSSSEITEGYSEQVNETNDKGLKFFIKEGKQYALCNDLLEYLLQNYTNRTEFEKTLFSVKSSKFSTPTYIPIPKEQGMQIDIQNFAYSKMKMYGFSGWLKTLERFEKRLKDTDYFVINIDLNNDGKSDKVHVSKYFNQQHRVTTYSNFPLNEYGNLNVNWFHNQKPSSVANEVFIYDGRTFLIGVVLNTVLVQEPNEVKRERSVGIRITPNVCKIDF